MNSFRNLSPSPEEIQANFDLILTRLDDVEYKVNILLLNDGNTSNISTKNENVPMNDISGLLVTEVKEEKNYNESVNEDSTDEVNDSPYDQGEENINDGIKKESEMDPLNEDNSNPYEGIQFKCSKCDKLFRNKNSKKYHKDKVCEDAIFVKVTEEDIKKAVEDLTTLKDATRKIEKSGILKMKHLSNEIKPRKRSKDANKTNASDPNSSENTNSSKPTSSKKDKNNNKINPVDIMLSSLQMANSDPFFNGSLQVNEATLNMLLDTDNYRCQRCNRIYKSKESRRYHAKKVCLNTTFVKVDDTEDFCDKSKVNESLKNKKTDSTEEKFSVKRTKYTDGTVLYSCPKCEEKCKTTEDIYVHMSAAHSSLFSRKERTIDSFDKYLNNLINLP